MLGEIETNQGDVVVHPAPPTQRARAAFSEAIFRPTPGAIQRAQITAFTAFCEAETARTFETPAALHAFSVAEMRTFWALFLRWSGLVVEGSAEPVCVGEECEHATFFPDLRVSYVENLLKSDGSDSGLPAITACNEQGDFVRLTRGELSSRVLAVASALRRAGVGPGDRVVAIASNTAETVVACLASLALGATWSSIAPDVGSAAVLARFAPLSPKALFFHASYLDGGARHSVADRIAEVARGLSTLTFAVALRDEPLERQTLTIGAEDRSIDVAQLTSLAEGETLFRTVADLPRLPWNHPLFILFSSGTTGRPKCLVHGAGGTLIEHHKEHRLHGDLGPEDKLYFHTTCSWMMWNWLVSALACRTEIVLYEGSLTHPEPDTLWRLIAREQVTVFGTSPAFLQYTRDAKINPGRTHDLSRLRAIQSTGSVLKASLFEWAREAVREVPIQSISGGTDILGCFLLGHPALPVYAGELQSLSLGLDVRALAAAGATRPGAAAMGELVCANPFPSRPIGILNDPTGQRFHDTYFAANPGFWTHGDLLEWTSRGTAKVHGRTDGVLNVRGVRIGPAEIYGALEAIEEIAESMAIEQRAPLEAGGSRLVLLVVLRPGLTLDKELMLRIRRHLAERCSQAHVPSVIAQVAEVPQTHNGKRAERAARDAANGDPVANLDALKNPRSLDVIRSHPALVVAADAPGAVEAAAAPVTPAETKSRDAIEEKLVPIWERALASALNGVKLGTDDNFHDLGGHSLHAVALLVQVEQAFGRRLPMGTFLASGATIAGMASELARPAAPSQAGALVTLQPNGDKLPVYWLPGGGGVSTIAFREVSLLLGSDQPVYGFEASLVADGAPRDLRSRAREYVRELRATRPGPYVLLGFSYGSYMAFEVGCQLREAGEQVAMLAVFDTPAPQHFTRKERMTIGAQRLKYHVRKLRTERAHLGFLVNELKARSTRQKGQGDAATEPGGTPDVARSLFDETNRLNLASIVEYAKGPLRSYPGRITVFLADKTSQSGVAPELDDRLAWRHVALDGIEVHRVNASHLSMLVKPDSETFAAALRTCLESLARERSAPSEEEWDPVSACTLRDYGRLLHAVRLADFRAENAKLGPRAPEAERVVLLGDSRVEGFDVGSFFPGHEVLNRGITADHLATPTGEGLLHRLTPDLLAPDPSHILLMIGVNDVADNADARRHVRTYDVLVSKLRGLYPDATLVCQSLPPTGGAYAYLNERIVRFNRELELFAGRREIRFVDLNAPFADQNGELRFRYGSDGIHLQWRGYSRWRNLICDVMGWPHPRGPHAPATVARDTAKAMWHRMRKLRHRVQL